MRSVFEVDVFEELNARLDRLGVESRAQWGKMNVGQMLTHVNTPLEGQLGKVQSDEKGNFLFRLLFKKMLYSDKPFGRNLPTAKSFVITDVRDFEREHARLKANLLEAKEKGLKGSWARHPAFGVYTPAQHGMMIYKHLDHHFRQFGV